MSTSRPEVLEFVESRFPNSRIELLAGDASTRRFFRIRDVSGPSRVLMDYGKPFAGETDDIRMTRILTGAGLPVARILETAGAVGCLVLEDLGDRTLQSAWEELDVAGRPFLERAVRLAADVGRLGTPALARSERSDGPALDAERFRFEMDFYLEHYVRGLLGRDRDSEGLRTALHALADRAADSPCRVLCHRDFHSRNLLLQCDGSVAMVDIQDARWGPDSYDLASLLRDAYLEFPETWIDSLVDQYVEHAETEDSGDFRRRLGIVSCQRMIKALGTFGSLRGSSNADRYLGAVPRTIERLRRLLPLENGEVFRHMEAARLF